ncbi:MAG: NAD(P)-binding domain-containing protein [Ginsengibacter sp.]
MASKKTIAIVGANGKTGRAIVNRFSGVPHRLLLVSDQFDELHQLVATLIEKKTIAEIEALECVKDSCWEADIIVMAVEPTEEKEVGELMKEVATQKEVVVVSDMEHKCDALKKVLPYSKVIKAKLDVETNTINLSVAQGTVNEEISRIFIEAGYKTTLIDQH